LKGSLSFSIVDLIQRGQMKNEKSDGSGYLLPDSPVVIDDATLMARIPLKEKTFQFLCITRAIPSS
jgi:hypothetical protein